jgi:hypothetical protein
MRFVGKLMRIRKFTVILNLLIIDFVLKVYIFFYYKGAEAQKEKNYVYPLGEREFVYVFIIYILQKKL